MRQLILLLGLAVTPCRTFAQVIARPGEYAVLEAQRQLKEQVRLVFHLKSQVVNNELLDDAEYIKRLTNEMDGLNYLTARGWEIITITSETFNGHTCGTRYYLRKSAR